MTYRNGQFVRVINYYRKRYKAMEENGQSPYRFTALGAWAASRAPMFFIFSVDPFGPIQVICGLGSGDGLVACLAGLFTRSIGIEIDRNFAGRRTLPPHILGWNGRSNSFVQTISLKTSCQQMPLHISRQTVLRLEKMLAD
jgi:hypothetical protein